MASGWIVRIDEKDYPAADILQLQTWAAESRIQPSHYVYNPILERWMYAKDVEELKAFFPVATPPPAPALERQERIERRRHSELAAASALLLSVGSIVATQKIFIIQTFDTSLFAAIIIVSIALAALAIVASHWSVIWWYANGKAADLNASQANKMTYVAFAWGVWGSVAFCMNLFPQPPENVAIRQANPIGWAFGILVEGAMVLGIVVAVAVVLKKVALRWCLDVPLGVSFPVLIVAVLLEVLRAEGYGMEVLLLWACSAVVGGMLLANFEKTNRGVLLGVILGPLGCVIALVWRMNLASNETRSVANRIMTARMQAEEARMQPPSTDTVLEELRECPYCAERILKKAKFCKHCRQDVAALAGC